ncbi:DUF3990 domain-containing protein [Lachnospiraceae bacterium OttesenSCG-928-D06]|nr:DUF3990 domain-containing protein [Lachnospiraceae bacterium OttesenSCG-928-D06]
MKLFHGSNVEVKYPKIRTNLRALDFGAGFYLTSSREQAVRWAKTVVRRRRKGQAILNIYELDEDNLKTFKVLRFETANEKWLDFVVNNRKELPIENQYDIVIGPVANDATLPVIDDYMDGVYTKEEAVKRLLPQNLSDQYAFLTNEALEGLVFEGSEV